MNSPLIVMLSLGDIGAGKVSSPEVLKALSEVLREEHVEEIRMTRTDVRLALRVTEEDFSPEGLKQLRARVNAKLAAALSS